MENVMNKRKINKKQIFFVITFLVLVLCGIWTWQEDLRLAIIVISLGCVLAVSYLVLFHNSYKFTEEGIEVCYLFGIKNTLAWDEIKLLEDRHSRGNILFWRREYHIGYFETKFRLWETVSIPKSKEATEIIEKHYQGKIDKY